MNEPTPCGYHDSEELFGYVLEHLDLDARGKLEQHLVSCGACRQRIDTLQWLHSEARTQGQALFSAHVGSAALLCYAESPERLDAGHLEAIREHLSRCESCEADLRVLQEVNRDIPASSSSARIIRSAEAGAGSFSSRWRPRLSFLFLRPALGYVVAVILLFPAGWGLWSFSVGGWGNADRSAAVESVARTIDLPLGDDRGSGPADGPEIVCGGRVALRAELPMSEDPAIRYDGRIEDESGQARWAGRDLSSEDRYGSFMITIVPERLGSGRYRWIIAEVDRDDGTLHQEFAFSFRIVPPKP